MTICIYGIASARLNFQRKMFLYSKLNEEDITDEDYERAQQIWKIFKIKIGEYHDFYLSTDVYLLADVL